MQRSRLESWYHVIFTVRDQLPGQTNSPVSPMIMYLNRNEYDMILTKNENQPMQTRLQLLQ